MLYQTTTLASAKEPRLERRPKPIELIRLLLAQTFHADKQKVIEKIGYKPMRSSNRSLTRFSIIIPTYNSSETLSKTLQSISDQGWPEVEVVIIDGGSTDRTIEIAESFQSLKLTIVSEPDKGIYDAINKGIALATGDLICIVGSDDRLASGALESVDKKWYSQRTDIIAGEALLEAADGTQTKRIDEEYGIGCLISGIPFCHNSMYVSRETYRKIGGYNLDYKICADAEWVHRSVRAGCTCARIKEPLVHFALSGTSSINDELIMIETYKVITANFPELSVNEAEILFKAVRRWTDTSRVAGILKNHQSNTALTSAVLLSIKPTIATAAQSNRATHNGKLFVRRALRKIRCLFRHGLKSN